VHDEVVSRLVKAYEQLLPRSGDPLDTGTLLGPMHSQMGVDNYKAAIEEIKKARGKIAFGGNVKKL
jgi:aldehyde dehydrogenase family 7 protein A1